MTMGRRQRASTSTAGVVEACRKIQSTSVWRNPADDFGDDVLAEHHRR